MSSSNSTTETTIDDAQAAPGFSLLPALMRRWPFLLLGLFIGAAIGLLIYTTSVPLFQASAQVLILKKRNEVIKDGDMRIGTVDDYVATQVTLIKSEKIRLAAAQKARGMAFTQPLPEDNYILAGMIGANLTIARDKDVTTGMGSPGSSVLNLAMNGGHPEDCRKLLQAVILAHQSELYAIYDQATTDKLATLDRLADAIKEQRRLAGEQKIQQLAKLREITLEEVANIRQRVSANRTQQKVWDTELIDLKDQLELIAKTGPNEQDRLLTLAQITAQLKQTPFGGPNGLGDDMLKAGAKLRELEITRRELSEKVGLGKDNPRILSLDRQIAELKADLEEHRAPAKEGPDAKPLAALDQLGAHAVWAEQKRKSTERKLQQIGKQIEDDEKILKTAGGLQDRIEGLSATITQQDSEIKRLEADKLTTTATQGAGGYTLEQITPPAIGRKVSPILSRALMQGLMIGLLIGTGFITLIEMNDKSFRSPAEIRQRLGIPVIGHVPALTGAAIQTDSLYSGIDPTLITAHRPKSTEAEAYRGLRTQIFFSTQGRGHQVIQVTSPTPGDGKSTTAANLAIAIAQVNKKTLLVDCDFRKPRQQKMFGVTGEKGLAGVIAGTDQLSDALYPTGVPNLDILPCGTRPANPAELLSSPQFQDALRKLRELYEFVIVDTPPVLAVTDPLIVAPRVDGVIIVFRMSKKVRPNAEWAREALAGVGAKPIGVVINASDSRQRGYGYGYGYGYKYGYGYGYNYNYQYTEKYHDELEASR